MRTRSLNVALALLAFLTAALAAQQQPQSGDNPAPPAQGAAAAVKPLDYEVFKTQVQPIFLKKRPGHARCYACHALGAGEGGPTNVLRLQVLSPGATTWDEEQSQKNFAAIRTKVIPGNMRLSRLLIHPLRYESGGDQWHGGGGQFSSANDPDWQVLAAWVMGKPFGAVAGTTGTAAAAAPSVTSVPTRAAAGSQTLKLRIVVANAAGDNIHIIDPAANKVIGEVTGFEVPHGIAAAPDGSRLYVTNEVERTVDVVDVKALKISTRIPLNGQPNNVAISHDGRRVYAAIVSEPGGVDVIDTATLTNVKHIPLDGMVIHNPFVTPDGKFLLAVSNDAKTEKAAVIDQKTEEPVRTIYFDGRPENPTEGRPRPLAFSTNPDGSTKWIFSGLTGLHGFVVTDFATGKELRKIQFPDLGGQIKMQVVNASVGNPSHGIGVQPGNKAVWISDRWYNLIHVYSLPDLNYVGAVPVGVDPFWVTFTPDGKFAYVPNDSSAVVSAIDTQSMKEIARIPVGWVPKRVITAMLP